MPFPSELRCSGCRASYRPADRFCSQCGRVIPVVAVEILPEGTTAHHEITTVLGDTSHPSAGPIGDQPLAPGEVFARRYRIERLVGAGGMGRVYLATDMTIDEPIAIKVLSAAFSANGTLLDQFKLELKLARRIRHRNVVASFHLGEAHGMVYITQEYIDAENLSSLSARRGPLEPIEVLGILRQILRGLKAAHDLEIVHRDIKASNILVNKDGVVFVTDFGLAVSASHVEGMDVAGTPHYMAPELFRGRRATPSSDLYACGVLMYYLLTTRLPFPQGRSFRDAAHAHENLEPKAFPATLAISPAIVRLYERLLARDPFDRPQSAGEVLGVIESVLAADELAQKHGRPMALLADGDPGVRGPAREVLESEGYAVEEVASANEAIERAFAQDPALVVIDSDVEGGEELLLSTDSSPPLLEELLTKNVGLRLCRLLQSDARLRRVPILMMTSKHFAGLKPAFQALGVSEVIAKPFTRAEFAAGAQRARGASREHADDI